MLAAGAVDAEREEREDDQQLERDGERQAERAAARGGTDFGVGRGGTGGEEC